MKYTKPSYIKEDVSTGDILLLSANEGVSITDKGNGKANVSASVLDILGIRR